jgi:hypothetical protein
MTGFISHHLDSVSVHERAVGFWHDWTWPRPGKNVRPCGVLPTAWGCVRDP